MKNSSRNKIINFNIKKGKNVGAGISRKEFTVIISCVFKSTTINFTGNLPRFPKKLYYNTTYRYMHTISKPIINQFSLISRRTLNIWRA